MKPRRSYALVFLLLLLAAVRLLAADAEFYYHYRGSKIALDLDADNIAVKLTSQKNSGLRPAEATAKSFADKAKSLGYNKEEAEGYRPGGWIKLKTKSANAKNVADKKAGATPEPSPKEKQKKLIDDLAKVDDVEFISPIFKDARGQPVTFEPRLLVGFVGGVSEAEQDRVLHLIAKLKTIERHGLKDKWFVQIDSRSGVDLLDAANSIAALPGVRYAEPNFMLVAEAL